MDSEKRLAELLIRHKGEENAISSQEIADILRIKDGPGTRQTRELIKKVITKYWLPVGANEKGYYWITSAEELERYLTNLRRRIRGIENRIEAVEIGYIREKAQRGGTAEEAASVIEAVIRELTEGRKRDCIPT